MNNVTVVTPVFNRKELLFRLMRSLNRQTSKCFKWLIIDDGSTDGLREEFSKYITTVKLDFKVQYIYKENGGKQRAINDAVKIVDTEYIFIVDSDDILVPDAIEKVLNWINVPEIDHRYAGVAGIRGNLEGFPIGGNPIFQGDYIDCTNLDRGRYNLLADMAEVYKTEVLKKYPFTVWEGEKFLPEVLVWDKIAENGYLIRWYKDIIYLCDYLEGGLTKGSWKLLRDNPMGYARLFEHNYLFAPNTKSKIKNTIMMDSCLILAKNIKYLRESQNRIIGTLLLPFGFLLMLRRKAQFKKYIDN